MTPLLVKYNKMLNRLEKLKKNYLFHFENEEDNQKVNKSKLEGVDRSIAIVLHIIGDLEEFQKDE